MSATTDERGLCLGCGGHGSVTRREAATPENLAPLRPRARARAEAEGCVYVSEPCGWCDGHDLVTPMTEAAAP